MARILVAEDDQFTREMVQRALKGEGHEVVATEDGGDAMAAYEAGAAFDLVVTDVEMPGVSGLELAGNVLARDPAQRVIIMSGLAGELTRARELQSPNVRVITKPVTLETIKAEAAALLG